MRSLDLLKGAVALLIIGSVFNEHFDLLPIPHLADVHISISILCFALFSVGLYHDRLSRSLMKQSKSGAHHRYAMVPHAGKELLFREGLTTFLLAIPVIPTFYHFPREIHLGMGVLLFSIHGLIRCLRFYRGDNLELVLAEDRISFTLRSARSILYQNIREVKVKYEHIYFILKDGRVEDLPLAYFDGNGKGIMETVRKKLEEKGVKNKLPLQEETSGSANS